MQELIDHARLGELLRGLGYADDASGFHGLLCGALCALRTDQLDFLRLLDAGGELRSLSAAAQAQLEVVRDAVYLSLISSELGFTPLLPPDELSLSQRVQALSAWCDGFLYGLASHLRLDLEQCSDETQEVIRDLSQFTQAGVGSDADADDSEEAAFAEIVEYVRVGAQLVFMELHPRPQLTANGDAASPTLH